MTYYTFLIGSLAIAGVPLLSGFFSKDEILYETFREGHTLLWVVGALTSLLTATYMFRLVFLTFHGQRRHDAPVPENPEDEEHPHDSQPSHDPHLLHPSHQHDDRSHPIHEPPAAMTFVLIALAVGSIFAGYIGIPHALGGHNALHAWLEPAFEAPGAAAGEGAEAVAQAEAAAAGADAEDAASPEETQLELTLMAVSSAIALLGIGIAWAIWIRRRAIADQAARTFAPLYRLLLNKYYVDELYDATVVQPIRVISQEGLWRGFDVKVIDGVVNGTAEVVGASATVLRRLQTGSVRTYAGSLFVGVVVILGYYLWR
jgi:NADH-quinone oxidoreductase subunit L